MARRKQGVTLGRTRAGRPGLFTGGVVAWEITDNQYAAFRRDPEAARSYCERLNFTYLGVTS